MSTRRIYKFGPFLLDATAKVLQRGDTPVKLARKAVETLLVLVENSGRVVTKEELMSALWPDRVVDEANLAQNVAVIRRALGVDRGAVGYIENFPGRGYRIVGPVSEVAVEHPAASAAPARGRSWRWLLATAMLAIGALALAIWRRAPPAPAAPAGEFHRIPVTRLAGNELQPAVSPDGVRVAFVWEQEGQAGTGIWIQRTAEDQPKRVTPEDDARYSSPAWSPDGSRLAYLRFRGSNAAIVISSADGAGVQVAGPVFPSRFGLANRHLDWSPDGKLLAFDDAEGPQRALALFVLDLATGRRTRLTTPDPDFIGDMDPRFSPDGKTIAFIRAPHRGWQELYTIPAGGGSPRQVTSDQAQLSGQDWLPGGGLVYASNRSGEFRIWRQKPGQAPQSTGIYADFPMQVAAARNAPVLAYSVLRQDLNIWRLEFAGRRWTRLIASSGQDVSPQYSPDGSRICFRSDRSGEEQLWVTDRAGRNPVQITHGSVRPSVGRWSPDGEAIVFNNPRSLDIYVVREAAGEWRTEPLGARGVHPVFSPDGKWIYAGTDSIVRIPANGGAPTEVTRTRGLSLGVSAGGAWIYFVREPAATSLWRVEIASGRFEKVLEGLVPFCTSCWAPTPSGVYFLGSDADRQALYYYEFATGRSRLVLEYPEPLPPIGVGPFSLSPDGRSLLSVRVDPSNSDIFRVEPFR